MGEGEKCDGSKEDGWLRRFGRRNSGEACRERWAQGEDSATGGSSPAQGTFTAVPSTSKIHPSMRCCGGEPSRQRYPARLCEVPM